MSHTPNGYCTSDCRRVGCPDVEIEERTEFGVLKSRKINGVETLMETEEKNKEISYEKARDMFGEYNLYTKKNWKMNAKCRSDFSLTRPKTLRERIEKYLLQK